MSLLLPTCLLFLLIRFMRERNQKAMALLSLDERTRVLSYQAHNTKNVTSALIILVIANATITTIGGHSIPTLIVSSVAFSTLVFGILAYTSLITIREGLVALRLPDTYIRHRFRDETTLTIAMGVFFAYLIARSLFVFGKLEASW